MSPRGVRIYKLDSTSVLCLAVRRYLCLSLVVIPLQMASDIVKTSFGFRSDPTDQRFDVRPTEMETALF